MKIVFAVIMLSMLCFVGCSTHKHCGTAHYSTATSQDFENLRQRSNTEYYLLNMNSGECGVNQ